MIETLKKQRGHQFVPTKAQMKKIPNLYGSEGIKDPEIQVRYFSITGWEWYVIEMDPETTECFGLVKGFETEMGYFSLAHLEGVMKGPFVAVERDLYFQPTKLSEIQKKIAA